MINTIQNLSNRQKNLVVITYDATCITLSFLLAHSLRFGLLAPGIFTENYFLLSVPIVTLIQSLVLYVSGVYKSIWRFSSIPDLIRVIRGVTLGLPISIFALFLLNRLEGFPRSAFLIDWFLLIFTLGGGRFLYRIISDAQRSKLINGSNTTPVLIIGAGVGGEKLLRDIKYTPSLGIRVVGFIDDNKGKTGRVLNGVKVLGTTDQLNEIVHKYNIQKVIIAIPSATSRDIRAILSKVNDEKIEVKTLPKINDVLYGKIEYSQLRAIEPEDLLGRTPVNLDMREISNFLKGKRVLITGAGGSIGTEICKQVMTFGPEFLIGFEQNEFAVYELEKSFPQKNAIFVIGDIRDLGSVESIFKKFKPDVVFHAAAYKHVPLMEKNPIEAINTNIRGTLNAALSSIENNVKKFVLISTDKAINPTNVMGTTKRIAEQVCQSLDSKSNTEFVMIRFGNVLGSSGSVIPLFKEQIASGGPVTVTHPDVIRYFMSIPEACQLVLQAGAMGIHGQVMVLDMGHPIKIYDLAKEMIRLAGFKPEIDIEIKFTGLRPGEKMFEELFKEGEKRAVTTNDKIFISMTNKLPENFNAKLEKILKINHNTTKNEALFLLKEIVPEFEMSPPEESSKVH